MVGTRNEDCSEKMSVTSMHVSRYLSVVHQLLAIDYDLRLLR